MRRWMTQITALPLESEPGTHILLIAMYEANSGPDCLPARWDAMHDGVIKWYYDSEIEKNSEVISG